MDRKRRIVLKTLGITILMKNSYSFALENNFVGSRLWSSDEHTRITIETNNRLKYKDFFLSNPYRYVVDIEGIEEKNISSLLMNKLDTKSNILNIKSSLKEKNVTRIVIELKEKVDPKIFNLKPIEQFKERLVIDLVYKNKERPLAKKNQENKKINKKYFIVAIDAGHGGEDPGAIGENGTYEKDVTLSIAKKIKAEIDKIEGFKGVLIRDGDYFIPLYERIEKAQRKKADIFLSIHADAAENKQAKGSSVYVLSENGASSANAKWLVEKENISDLIGGTDINISKKDAFIKKTLLDLSFTANISESKKLADSILSYLQNIVGTHKERVEYAGFAVLKSPSIPSVLVETAFISNSEEEKKLNSNTFQMDIAKSITMAILGYVEKTKKI